MIYYDNIMIVAPEKKLLWKLTEAWVYLFIQRKRKVTTSTF